MSSSTLLCAIMEKLKVALENRDSCSLLLRPKVFYFQCKSMTSIVLIIWHLWQGRKENILKRLLAHHLIWAQTRLSVPHGLKKEDVEEKNFYFLLRYYKHCYNIWLPLSICVQQLNTNYNSFRSKQCLWIESKWIGKINKHISDSI